jgi:hypothetical protein
MQMLLPGMNNLHKFNINFIMLKQWFYKLTELYCYPKSQTLYYGGNMKAVKFLTILFVLLILSKNVFGATVSMPDISGNAGETVDIPVNIDNATGLAGFQITVTYNATVLNCTTVLKGSLISSGWDSMTVNSQSGQIFGQTNSSDLSELGNVSGDLAKIRCIVTGAGGASTSLHFMPSPATQLSNGIGDPISAILRDSRFTVIGACVPTGAEVCDGADNDCDGQIDEDIAPMPTTCGVGACGAAGQSVCQGGQMVETCTPAAPQAEGPVGNISCEDQLDNDCDGLTDSTDSDCGGQCFQEICDGVDNDCDGQIDEDIAPVPTTCGVGACGAAGQSMCQGGQMVETCTPGIPASEICNGIDDNCNGSIDDGIDAIPITCGKGMCQRSGNSICQDGEIFDSCTPGSPQTEGLIGSAACKDGLDNDCDGLTDNEDSNCNSVVQPPDMSQWVGQWFKVKTKIKGNTFNENNSTFSEDKGSENGYIYIWEWNQDTQELQFDYYVNNNGQWYSDSAALHFFAGTDTTFMFWYDKVDDKSETAFNGMIEGKMKGGILKSAIFKTLGGFYTEIRDNNNTYSNGTQTINGNLIEESKVPVPLNVLLPH